MAEFILPPGVHVSRACRSCPCCGLTVGTDGRCEDGHEAPPSPLPYDNCGSGCYTSAGHTMLADWCAHAPAKVTEPHPVGHMERP